MEACQEGYPCVYFNQIDENRGRCMLRTCAVKHVTLPTDKGKEQFAYDTLMGLLKRWVTIDRSVREADEDTSDDIPMTDDDFERLMTENA